MNHVRFFDSSELSDSDQAIASLTFNNNTYRLIQQLQKNKDCDKRFLDQCMSFFPEIALHLNPISENEKGDNFPSVPRCGTVGGCILLADISGFTKLSALAHEKGATGLDYFRLQTEAFLSEFVNIVEKNGGEGKNDILLVIM